MQRMLGNLSQGFVFVLSAPAGTGKTTLVRMLSQEFPCVYESISCTTRSIRPGEVEGKDYHFISKECFSQKIAEGDFLEYAEVFGDYYGTSKSDIIQQQQQGKHVFLIIDTQGAMQLRDKGFPAILIFLSPPSLEELQRRLVNRQTDSSSMIERRLSWAEKELSKIDQYDYHIVNDCLEGAYDILRSIVISQEHRVLPNLK